jgi:integrase
LSHLPVSGASRKSPERSPYRSGELSLSAAEVARVLDAAPGFDDRVLLEVAISSGIRREDVVAIRREGVEFDGEVVVISYFEAKKARDRHVRLGGRVVVDLRAHLKDLPRGSRWVFPSRKGSRGHLSGRAAYDILQRSLEGAHLPARPFHVLRATCVKLAQARGWSPEQVSELTGDSLRTIQRHYSVPTIAEMGEAARSRPLL